MLVTGPAHGTLTLNADGSFTYTPTAGYTGTDSFTYKANDGTARLQHRRPSPLTVGTGQRRRRSADDDSYTVDRGSTAADGPAPGVLANDTDIDRDPLTAGVVAPRATARSTLNADGSFTYTPTADYHGADSFTYKATDGTSH